MRSRLTRFDAHDSSIEANFLRIKNSWKSEENFEDSWLYVCQACRDGGWIVETESILIVISEGYFMRGNAVVWFAYCPGLSTLADIFTALRHLPLKVSLFKHFPLDRSDILDDIGWMPLKIKHGIPLDEISEDAYPQVCISLENQELSPDASVNLSLPTSSDFYDFRYQVRRFRRRLSTPSVECFIPVDKTNLVECRDCVHRWARNATKRFRQRGWPILLDPVATLIQPNLSVLEASLSFSAFAIRIDGVVRALWVCDLNFKHSLGVYLLIAETDFFNLSYFNLATVFDFALRKGRSEILLGGSEVESLFRFKSGNQGVDAKSMRFRRVVDLVPVSSE